MHGKEPVGHGHHPECLAHASRIAVRTQSLQRAPRCAQRGVVSGASRQAPACSEGTKLTMESINSQKVETSSPARSPRPMRRRGSVVGIGVASIHAEIHHHHHHHHDESTMPLLKEDHSESGYGTPPSLAAEANLSAASKTDLSTFPAVEDHDRKAYYAFGMCGVRHACC